MTTPGGWVFAIDFGTTNTVASMADARGVRTLTIDAKPGLPSAVFLVEGEGGEPNSWMVGDNAIHMARRRLDWFEPSPKRAIGDRWLFLGHQDIPVVDAIAAVLTVFTEEASLQHGSQPPETFVVTHPAMWAQARIDLLLQAAKAATSRLSGWPEPRPVVEPVAAAHQVLDIDELPTRARLVVLDLGGGTVDVTVVDRDADSLALVGRPIGRDGFGGEDFDLRLARWLTAEAGAPDLYDRLAESDDLDENELAVEIRTGARRVKEQLSRQNVVPTRLPKSPPELPDSTPVQVNKQQLEELIKGGEGRDPGLIEAVEMTSEALDSAPTGPPLFGVFLVGGSSRIPLLGLLVTERVGVVPVTRGDPTTAVADGAARMAWKALESEPREEYVPPQPPREESPFAGQEVSPPFGGTGGPPPFGGTGGPPPFGGTGGPPPFGGTGGPPPFGGTGGPPPGDRPYPGHQPMPSPPERRDRRRRGRGLLIGVLAVVLLAAAGTAYSMSQSPKNASTSRALSVEPAGSVGPVVPSFTCSNGSVVRSASDCPSPSTTPSNTSSYGRIYGDSGKSVPVLDSPSVNGSVLGTYADGTLVEIECTTEGDAVQRADGRTSSLWDRTPYGYIPDMYINTGTNDPTMPDCSLVTG